VGLRDLVINRWANLSHKTPMRDDIPSRIKSDRQGWSPRTWIGDEHRHRLSGYVLLSGYLNNVSRHFLETTDADDISDRREYGDPALLRDQIRDAVLGETIAVSVRDAERYDPDLDGPPPAPQEGQEPDESDVQARAENTIYRGLAERQEWLQEWADDVHLELRLVDLESNAVGMGDGVLLLGWDADKQRVVPAVMDPGFYFPVLPDTIDGYAYPTRVHFAWELDGENYPDGKTRVRRITYELVDLAPSWDEDLIATMGPDEDITEAMSIPDGTRWVTLKSALGEERVLVREYPWRPGENSTRTCLVTDATYKLDDLKDIPDVDSFDERFAVYALDGELQPIWRKDLEIDFLPVIHVPNSPPGGEHYGESSIARVLQILDDIQNADTDAEKSAATTGAPITWSSGAGGSANPLTGALGKTLDVKPGTHWDLGADGSAGSIDTSTQLSATREYVKHLLDRLSVNARMPAVLLGTVKPSEVPSGFAMSLSFGPLSSMIRVMRLVRSSKYPLLLKQVQRLAQANGALPPGETPHAEIAFGSFLPTDVDAVLKRVIEAWEAKVISLETGVTMLLEAGFPIDDVAEEIVRIGRRDYEAANALADATGDTDAVRDLLGMDPAPTAQAAPVTDPVTGLPIGAPPVAGGTGTGVPARTDSGGAG
jgi:hypothetical protein